MLFFSLFSLYLRCAPPRLGTSPQSWMIGSVTISHCSGAPDCSFASYWDAENCSCESVFPVRLLYLFVSMTRDPEHVFQANLRCRPREQAAQAD